MKIVAIGGGGFDLNSEEKPFSLAKTCDEIVKLAKKKCPRFVYIGFNQRADYYFGMISKIFMPKGCQCIYLRFSELSNAKTVESKIKRADIIFLPGGNTLDYMKKLTRYKIKEQIIEKVKNGTVMAGISAGAIMAFECGISDSKTKLSESGHTTYSKVKGFGLMRGVFAPHFLQSDRKFDAERILKSCKKGTICFGTDENCSLIIDDDNYKIITETQNDWCYKLYLGVKNLQSQKLNPVGKVNELYE